MSRHMADFWSGYNAATIARQSAEDMKNLTRILRGEPDYDELVQMYNRLHAEHEKLKREYEQLRRDNEVARLENRNVHRALDEHSQSGKKLRQENARLRQQVAQLRIELWSWARLARFLLRRGLWSERNSRMTDAVRDMLNRNREDIAAKIGRPECAKKVEAYGDRIDILLWRDPFDTPKKARLLYSNGKWVQVIDSLNEHWKNFAGPLLRRVAVTLKKPDATQEESFRAMPAS